jgi:ATP-dependent helicase HrpB
MLPDLPIQPVLNRIDRALDKRRRAVVQAPPGAGKTTAVPLYLLDASWLGGQRILMLEPRRMAARAAAARMSELLGHPLGSTVGYHIRMDHRSGPATRVEVVTEGILTRRLQGDPALEGVGLVIFDEFHERSLNSDLGLALCLESTACLRDDLRLLVMSATLDADPVARLMGNAPVITARGRAWPVETRYHAPTAKQRRPAPVERTCAAVIQKALGEAEGDILAFLPGEGEIRRVERLLRSAGPGSEVDLYPLFAALPSSGRAAAIRPSPRSRRKIVLATSIAETSLTIEGVRVVVDAGLMRLPRFHPGTGMGRLVTLPVSRAAADQRRGRAGRTAPGVCYRLWARAHHHQLLPFTPPEILHADLAGLVLELAQWGVTDPLALAWLDPPPDGAFRQARDLLEHLGAVDASGRITRHGKRVAALGVHPRLGHMLLAGRAMGAGAAACRMAALLEERDLYVSSGGRRDCDLRSRMELLAGNGGKLQHSALVHRGRMHAIRKVARKA